jgi:hypothetical protein
MIRIKEAIDFYNENIKDEGAPRMWGKGLGDLIMEKNGEFYVSNWRNGKHFGKLTPDLIRKICSETGVDANFLLGVQKV